MNKSEIYGEAYRLLNLITPLRADCGKACNKACCSAVDEETGMYLFPYEEVMYVDCPPWLRVEETDFTYQREKNALIALCEHPCTRELRPLSCRIFPLFPYLDKMGELKIIMDPRGKGICPLVRHVTPNELDPAFLKSVQLVFGVLLRFEPIHTFVFALSRQIDAVQSIYDKYI